MPRFQGLWMKLRRQDFYLSRNIFTFWVGQSVYSTSDLCNTPCVLKKQSWIMLCTNTPLLTYKSNSAGKSQITCRDKEHRCISWWAGELSTSWCKDTSPPYSLETENRWHIEIVSVTMTGWSTQSIVPAVYGASWGSSGHLQSVVTHWLARGLQVPQCSLQRKERNTIRLGTNLN